MLQRHPGESPWPALSAHTRHNPVELNQEQANYLGQLGITELYPLVGNVLERGERLVLRLRRQFRPVPAKGWSTGSSTSSTALTAAAAQHALDEDPSMAAETSPAPSTADRGQSPGAVGVGDRGFQLDLDCPTRRLPRYGELPVAIRQKLPRGTQRSITGTRRLAQRRHRRGR